MATSSRRSAGTTPYKPLQTAELGRVETRRRALKLPVDALAERAGIEVRTLMRIRKSGRAWPREIRALKMALRSIEKERRAAAALIPVTEDDAVGPGQSQGKNHAA